MITEFDRSSIEGYYISDNAPESGKFIQIESAEAMLTLAYMHGMAGAGVEPNDEEAKKYSSEIIELTIGVVNRENGRA